MIIRNPQYTTIKIIFLPYTIAGEGVAIMPGVIIGKNAIIGANAVVTKNVAPNTVVGGIPARLLKIL